VTGMLPLWGAIGETPVETQFSDFYRARLKRVAGARTKASDVMRAYSAWAADNNASSIYYRALKRLLVRLGHRHFYSNSAWYGDLEILPAGAIVVSDVEQQHTLLAAAVLDRIDRIMAELAELRAAVAKVPR